MRAMTRRALIIAVDTYDHSGLRQLGSPVHDVQALTGVLGDPQLGAFEVTVSHNQPAHVIRGEVADFFATAERDDVLLLHFACHGLKSANGELYLAGADTEPHRLTATGLPARFVNEEMTGSRANRIALLLDCCYGGAFAKGTVVRAAADAVDVQESFPQPQDRGRVVITSTTATQYAFEGEALAGSGQQPSVFTSAVVRGLATGEADANGDGEVDLTELFDYVLSQVRQRTSAQTPSKWESGVQGRIRVAWTPAASRITAQPVPEQLAAQSVAPLVDDRLGAVSQLRAILLGEDVPAAAGALEVLQRMTSDDSISVQTSAANAIAEAQLRPTVPGVDLTEEPQQVVQLVGSALSRHFRATTTDPWLRIEQSGTALRVTVDPGALPEGYGELRGSISITTKIGQFSVPVLCRPAARWWPRATVGMPDLGFARRWQALAAISVVLCATTLGITGDMLHASSLLGLLYNVLLFGLLATGLVLMEREGSQRVVGHGIVTAYAAFFLADGVISLHGRSSAVAWLEFLAVVAFLAALGIRLWPLREVPRRLDLVPPTVRPLAWVPIGAAALQLFLLFVAIPSQEYGSTLADATGVLGGLLAVLPTAGLCLYAVLSRRLTADQNLFVRAALVTLVAPELFLMLSSLLMGPAFTYLGNDVWGAGLSAGWWVLLRAIVLAAQAGTTWVVLRGRLR
ncbi:hypothetical protein GCM10010174_39810 [Kutzneria viridogrisea]